ncbi:MAG: NAD(P)-dependent oxidoreductase [Acidimicrobiales bacterium]
MCSPDRNADAVVVVDEIVDVESLIQELPPDLASVVRSEARIPTGRGIAALLAGPGAEVSGSALDQLPDLRVVVVTSMGWDHVDTEAAASRGVRVVGVEPYCVDEVAEHALALVLNLLRGVSSLDAAIRAGSWDHAPMGRSVRGASLGIVGLGRIGSALAWRAAALGMNVSAFDPALGSQAIAVEEPGVRMVRSLDALVSNNDVVSLHVPLDKKTDRLVDASLLSRFRPGSYLVNVSRGDVVTEAALGHALREGRIAGAALDVLVSEPPAAGDLVLDFPRTVITPHTAWYSEAAVERVSRMAGRTLVGALSTEARS